jgi:hypothetical protein
MQYKCVTGTAAVTSHNYPPSTRVAILMGSGRPAKAHWPCIMPMPNAAIHSTIHSIDRGIQLKWNTVLLYKDINILKMT